MAGVIRVPVRHVDHGIGVVIRLRDTDDGLLAFIIWGESEGVAGWHVAEDTKLEILDIAEWDALYARDGGK